MSKEPPQPCMKPIPGAARYRWFRIELYGQLDRSWVALIDPLSFFSSAGVTRLEVWADQAGLRGILNRLWDLNLDIFSVAEIPRPVVRNGG